MLTILKAGSAYFAQVFAASFALGAIRSLLLVPQFGNRTAELLEMPVTQGGSVAQYLAGRDPVSKTLHAGMLASWRS